MPLSQLVQDFEFPLFRKSILSVWEMLFLHETLAAGCIWIVCCAAQTRGDIITKTVYSTCARTTSILSLPSSGWVSTNGSTIPYTFGPSTMVMNSTERSSTPVSATADLQSSQYSGSFSWPTATSTTSSQCMTSTPTPIVCPRSNNTVYFPPRTCVDFDGNYAYITLCDVLYGGDTIATANGVDSAEDCLARCLTTDSCIAIAYESSRGTCLFRSTVQISTMGYATGYLFMIRLRDYFMVTPPSSTSAPSIPPATSSLVHTTRSTSPAVDNSTFGLPPSPTTSFTQSRPTTSGVNTMSSQATLPAGTYIFGGTTTSTVIGGTVRTYTSEGVISTTTTGGFTTTYTSGGTTKVISGTSSPTALPTIGPNAAIGVCPAYSGHIWTDLATGNAPVLVGCGVTYSGTVISNVARRQVSNRASAIECASSCVVLAGCAGMSYTEDRCTLYSTILAQLDSLPAAFSILRLDETPGDGDTSANASSSATFSMSTSSGALIAGPTTVTLTQISTIISRVEPTTVISLVSASAQLITTTAPGQTTTLVYTTSIPASNSTIILPASTITSLVTFTTFAPASTITETEQQVSVSVSLLPASTREVTYTRDGSTIYLASAVVSTLPASTLLVTETLMTTRDGATIVETQILTTIIEPVPITTTEVLISTAMPSVFVSTYLSTPPADTVTLPRETFSPSPETLTQVSTIFSVLPPLTTTLEVLSYFTTTISAPGQTATEVSIITATNTVISTMPPSTSMIEIQYITVTAPAATTIQPTTIVSTVVSTEPTTLERTQTTILPASTLVSTEVYIRPTTIVSTQNLTIVSTESTTLERTQTTTLPASTVVSIQSTTLLLTETTIIPASTITTTYETTFPASTVFIISSAPGQTTTEVHTTVQSASTSTVTTTQVLPASTVTIIETAGPTPTCISSSDGRTYLASDGSQYLMLCGQDNAGTRIFGLTVPATDFSSCIEYCSSQGTSCAGITWQASNSQCYLKTTMQMTSQGGSAPIDSAIRLTGPGGTEARVQRIVNGGFDTGLLDPWTFPSPNGASVDTSGLSAVVLFRADFGSATIQEPMAVAVNDIYLLTFTASFSGPSSDPNGYPVAAFGDISLDNYYGYGSFSFMTNQSQIRMYTSGRLKADTTTLGFSLFATTPGSTITLDDIAFYTYSPSIGTNPLPMIPQPLIVDGNYVMQQNTQLAVAMSSTIIAGQSFTFTVNFQASIAAGYYCELSLRFNLASNLRENYEFTRQGFSTSGSYPFSYSGVVVPTGSAPPYDSFYAELGCLGGYSSVTLNNVYITANA
ncbi:hypothetical protein HII31_08050 [Pseudocercospora fuligena]|uniref:Apple domain-containing protein n=1 Tax=Pseudocercospora fuligena TaxID=685502 RepID=A0A8H6RE68_9PEZI|nr:hypothetical protein HII31_08050 [Pseudocercospora fuligena]